MGRIVRLLNLPCPCDFVDVTCSIFFALAAGSATCPDYVFGDGYSLVPLGDLEIFITREGTCRRSPAKEQSEIENLRAKN